MKPTLKSKTQEWTIEQLLQVEPRVEWYRDEHYEQDAYAETLYCTLVGIVEDSCGKPSGSLADVVIEPGKVVVTVYWLEMEATDANTESA